MIEAWRLSRARHADLSGMGAKLFGGRWNSPGRPVVYLAEHPALALVEVRVHLGVEYDTVPDDYVLMRVELPDEPPTVLAAPPADAAGAGDRWLAARPTAVLRVPSAVVPAAANYLLNPLHPSAALARVIETTPFRLDPRLWSGAPAGTPAP